MYTLPQISTPTQKAPRKVLSREIVWGGGFVRISVPANATLKNIPIEGGTTITALHFTNQVSGGKVNCFVHTTSPSLRGQKIVAQATVIKKTLEGESGPVEYLHIDYLPADSAVPTHDIRVQQREDQAGKLSVNAEVIKTPAPLKGAIVIAPLQ